METATAHRPSSARTTKRARVLTARRVRRARKLIARDACPAMYGIRHRWTGMTGLSGAGLFVRCRNCETIS